MLGTARRESRRGEEYKGTDGTLARRIAEHTLHISTHSPPHDAPLGGSHHLTGAHAHVRDHGLSRATHGHRRGQSVDKPNGQAKHTKRNSEREQRRAADDVAADARTRGPARDTQPERRDALHGTESTSRGVQARIELCRIVPQEDAHGRGGLVRTARTPAASRRSRSTRRARALSRTRTSACRRREGSW